METTAHELRSKMTFFAYASKDLDAIEIAFKNRYKRKPPAFLVRSPFLIHGSKENLKKIVLSQKYSGANAVYVPLLLDKDELEKTILALGEVQKKIYKERRKIERVYYEQERNKVPHKREYVDVYCRYCGRKFKTAANKVHCGGRECSKKHKLQLQIQRDKNLKKRAVPADEIPSSRLPDFNLDDPTHNTLQGYIYCIRAQNGLCKIGRSSDVEKRFSELLTMSPVDLFLDHVVFSDNYVLAESNAHGELDRYRHHGEWFDLPEEVHDWFLSLDNYDLDID